jgi:hypothetical protein
VSRSQWVMLGFGVVALIGLVLFPPWLAVSEWADGHLNRDECERHFLLMRPTAPLVLPELRARVEARRQAGAILYRGPDSYVVDWARQVIPTSVVAAVTLAGLVILRRRG